MPLFLFWKHRKILVLGIVAAFGWTTHVILDFLLVGEVPLLFPFLTQAFGLHFLVAPAFPFQEAVYLLSGLDAVLFLIWIWHEEKYKKIQDFF